MEIKAKEIASDSHEIRWKINSKGATDNKTYKQLVELLVK